MTLVLNGTTGIAGVDGSAATPAVQGADTNTGMFFPAADTIAFTEGGTEVMRINSSGQAEFTAGTAALPAITATGDTNTGIFFSAADTIDFAEGGVATGQFDSSGNFKFNSGYGSAAVAYGCRAWVNFDGTTNTAGFCTIRGSGNVTSVADNGVGDYTINFTTAMPDVNYACICTGSSGDSATVLTGFDILQTTPPTASSIRLLQETSAGSNSDATYANVAIFR